MGQVKWLSPAIWLPIFITVGVLLVLPRLSDAVWQDEAYTLINFSSHGFLYPFTDYHLPNNHVLLSALLSQWWSPGDSVVHLRLPLLLAFLLSIVILAWGTVRHFGMLAAVIATTFFVSCTITSNFALQLRGYGLSWLFAALMLWSLPSYLLDRRWLIAAVFSLAGGALLALIPTNLIVYGVLIAWGWWLVFLDQAPTDVKVRQLLAITLAPLLIGLIAYIGIWHQLLAVAGHGYSDWSKLELVTQLAMTFFSEYWLFLPLIMAGIYYLLKETKQHARQARVELGILLAVLVLPTFFLLIMKQAPFPRNLVPLLPVICVVLGMLTSKACAGLGMSPAKGAVVISLLAVVSFAIRSWLPCGQFIDTNRVGNLCQQYYQHDYQPETVMQYFLKNSLNQATILTGFEGMYALEFININYGLGMDIRHYKSYRAGSTRQSPWIVTEGDEKIDIFIKQLRLDASSYVQVLDTGYFKIYQPINTMPHK